MNRAAHRYVKRGVLIAVLILGVGSVLANKPDPPPAVVEAGEAYLSGRLGNQFFNSYVEFKSWKLVGGNAYLVERGEFLGQPHYEVVWSARIPSQPHARLRFALNISVENLEVRQAKWLGVPDCQTYPQRCRFPIDEELALDAAKEAGLEGGLGPWQARFRWSPEYVRYTWSVTSVVSAHGASSPDVLGDSGGQTRIAEVDAHTGEVLRISSGVWTE